MKKVRHAILLLLLVLGSAILTANATPGSATRTPGQPLTVFAAASLKEAFTAIAAQVTAQDGGTITFNFGGSQELVTQLAQGAPADVFASASMGQMTIAQSKRLLASSPVIFARNRLVVIVPATNPAHVVSLADLGRPGLRLVLAAPTVPVGTYARAAFAAMSRNAAFGPGFLARVEANVVSNETNVKAVVGKVVLGEADAGVVYRTDLTPRVASQVRSLVIPAPFNQVALYPIAVVAGSHAAALAHRFVAAVLSPAGQAVLRHSGFLPARE